MKNILICAAIILFTTITAFAQNPPITSIAIGTSIPKLGDKMKTVSGGKVSLNDVKTSRGLLVMFSCNTCPYVIKSQARTKEMTDYATRRGLGVIIINSNEAYRKEDDSYEEMKKYAKEQGYKVPYVVDEGSAIANAFGATRTPEVFLFDGDGKLAYKGAMEDNPSNPSESKQLYLKDAIENVVAGKEANPNATKSVGCTIKRI